MNKLSEEQKDLLYKSIVPIAYEARRTFINDNMPIEDSFNLIEQLGFLLLCFPSENNNCDLSGFFINKGNTKCIFINTNVTLGRQYTSVWHEFYHYYANEGQGLCYASQINSDPIEYKANAFAGCILMPENLIRNYMVLNSVDLLNISDVELVKMQNYFRVSFSALITRLIQVYPERKQSLKSWYTLSDNTEEAITKFKDLTIKIQGNVKLIQPTKEVYVPKQFYIDIEHNLREQKITKEKAYELLEFIEKLSVDGD